MTSKTHFRMFAICIAAVTALAMFGAASAGTHITVTGCLAVFVNDDEEIVSAELRLEDQTIYNIKLIGNGRKMAEAHPNDVRVTGTVHEIDGDLWLTVSGWEEIPR